MQNFYELNSVHTFRHLQFCDAIGNFSKFLVGIFPSATCDFLPILVVYSVIMSNKRRSVKPTPYHPFSNHGHSAHRKENVVVNVVVM